jgi:hypothetical protein
MDSNMNGAKEEIRCNDAKGRCIAVVFQIPLIAPWRRGQQRPGCNSNPAATATGKGNGNCKGNFINTHGLIQAISLNRNPAINSCKRNSGRMPGFVFARGNDFPALA